jgi:hypothetical protein
VAGDGLEMVRAVMADACAWMKFPGGRWLRALASTFVTLCFTCYKYTTRGSGFCACGENIWVCGVLQHMLERGYRPPGAEKMVFWTWLHFWVVGYAHSS